MLMPLKKPTADDLSRPAQKMHIIGRLSLTRCHQILSGASNWFKISHRLIGRLLISLLTVHWNLLPLPLLYLSAYFEQNRAQYYDLLLAVSQRGAWTEWLDYFFQGIAEQAGDAAARARALLSLQEQWHERLGEQRSANVLRLADLLLGQPVLTIPDVQQLLGVTYHTARNQVGKLVSVGVLKQMTEPDYGKLYAAEEILKILQ